MMVRRWLYFVKNSIMMNQVESARDQVQQCEAGDQISPQVRIYNRNFYLRKARFQELQEEVDKQIQELASKPKLTPNSYIILVQKLEHQLSQLYSRHLEQQDYLDFQHFQEIFNELGKFNHIEKEQEQFEIELLSTQLWLLVINYDLKEQYIAKNKNTSLIHILFCPYLLKPSEMVALLDHAFPHLNENRLKYIEEYPEASEEILDSDGLIKLWTKIKRNHLSSFAEHKKPAPVVEVPSFRPEINQKSKQYAKKQLQRYLQNNRLDNLNSSKLNELSGYISKGTELSYHEILYKRTLQKQHLLKTNRDQIKPHNKEKTFTNEETKKVVDNLYVIKQKRQDIDYSKIREEEELKLCTFNPARKEYHKRSTTPNVKNYDKEIDRLEEGRKKKQKLQDLYENMGKVKSKNSGLPPSMVDREKPRLILQIKVGERVVQLKLKGDEQPRIVAKRFVVKYDLEDDMQSVLESVITEQLAAL